jgi:hypothetical protein
MAALRGVGLRTADNAELLRVTRRPVLEIPFVVWGTQDAVQNEVLFADLRKKLADSTLQKK